MKSGGFLRDVAKVTFGIVFGHGLTILVAPILTRLYAPEAFGVAAVFVSVATIVSVVSCLKYELAIMLPKEEKEAADLLGLSVVATFLVTLLTIVGVWCCGAPLVQHFKIPELLPYLHWIPLLVFSRGLFLCLNHWTLRKKRFKQLSLSDISASSATAGLRVGLGWVGIATSGSLISAVIVGRLISVLVLVGRFFREDLRNIIHSISLVGMWRGCVRYRKFPLLSSWSMVFMTMSLEIPVLLLGTFFSPEVVGFYALGRRTLQVPISLVSSTISKVFFQRTAATRGQAMLPKIVEKAALKLVALGAAPLLLFQLLGPEIFGVAFGKEWIEAGNIVQFLTPWFFMVFVGSPISILAVVLEKQEFALLLNFLLLMTRVASLVIGGVNDNLNLSLILFSGSGFFLIGLFLLFLLKEAGVSLSYFVSVSLRTLSVACAFVFPLFFLKRLSWVDPKWLVILGLVVCILYYLRLFLTDSDLRSLFEQLLSERKGRGNRQKEGG